MVQIYSMMLTAIRITYHRSYALKVLSEYDVGHSSFVHYKKLFYVSG